MMVRLLALLWITVTSTNALGQETRTWKDSTGRFSITARLIAVTGAKVTLEREDGTRVEIELKKLSEADQKFVSESAANPFTPADSPFKPSMPAGGTGTVAGPRTVQVDWSSSDGIVIAAQDSAWQITPPTPLGSDQFRPRTVALPKKRDFFEGLKSLAVNPRANKAVVGYVMGRPGQAGSSRVVVCDLSTGRTVADAAQDTIMTPLALHDDGRQVVMKRAEFGFGKSDRLEIWNVQGKTVTKSLIWTPYDDIKGAGRDVMWAEFIDASTLATSSRSGKVALWDLQSVRPLCDFQLSDGSVPALSPDRKYIGFCSSKTVGVFDVKQRQVVASAATPRNLQWPYVAFSPSGTLLGCIAFNRMLVWNVADGQLQREIECTGINVHGAIAYPDDKYLLGGNHFLVDVENRIKLWKYDGADQFCSVGDWTLAAVTKE